MTDERNRTRPSGTFSGVVHPGPGARFAADAKITGPGVVGAAVNPDGSATVTWADEPPSEALRHSEGLVSISRPIGYDDGRKPFDDLCREAVKAMRRADQLIAENDLSSMLIRAQMLGVAAGIRIAVCLAMGWDPDIDADHEGKADTAIMDWWHRTHPDKEW